MGKYDDIIDLPHHQSLTHPQMSLRDRAAQFAPFAALTGYGDAINETARYTDIPTELHDDEIMAIDRKLGYLSLHTDREAAITYYVPDEKKNGGAYRTVRSGIRKVDVNRRCVILCSGERIDIDRIIKIEENDR